MSGAVCPSCGVAVVPGYVRCPKCHQPLPHRKGNAVQGGTALETSRRGPLIAVSAVAVLAIALITVVGMRKTKKPAVAATPPPPIEQREPTAPEAQKAAPEQPDLPAAQPSAPNAEDVAASLERALKKQKLWSKVEVVGDHVDVRSGSCGDPAMTPLFNSVAATFKAAGLTRIRCLEQSGRVVSDRDL